MKNIKTILVIILLVLTILSTNFFNCNIFAYKEIESQAKSVVIIDSNTNSVLYSKNMNLKLAEASTTKIITAIIAIENCDDLDKRFKISDKSVGIEGTSIYLTNNEELSMRELLYGLILASGNDCAVAIAEYFGGTQNFVSLMNDLAKKLDLNNTHFTNAHGLDEENHYTSAYDLAILSSYAMKNETFREIVNTKRYTIEGNEYRGPRYLKHKNRLMFENECNIGIKTGFTDNAGRCLVNCYNDGNMELIAVILNCGPMFEESNRLTDLVKNNYEIIEFIKPYSYIGSINVENGNKNKILVTTIEGYCMPILKAEKDHYEIIVDIPDVIEAPVAFNQIVGKIKVYYSNELIVEKNLYAIDEVERTDMRYFIDNILNNWQV